MTLIKSMTARGFKSFAKKTDIVFGENFNCVLGPNGSGKSNIVDGLCFVLGKLSAKGLRAEKTSHLIYNGGKKGSPAKEAEVSLVFDNSKKAFPIDNKEVKIARVVKENGTSIYKLNDDTVTRQQILETLSHAKIDPDGHNIILQGDIIRFMEMKPEQRREIIEEVSGIGVYEEKKQKSLLELNRVQEKLNEAGIIMHEKEINLRELKKDRDQALKYKELEENIKKNKATYLNFQIKERETKKEEIDKKISSSQEEIEKLRKIVLDLKTQVETHKKEIEDINKNIEEKGEIEQKKLHSDIEELKINLVKDKTRKDTCETEIQKIKARKIQLDKNITELSEKIKEIDSEKTKFQNQIKLSKSDEEQLKKELGTIKSKINGFGNLEEIEKKFDELLAEIETLKNSQQEMLRKKDNLENQKLQLNFDDSSDALSKVSDLRNNFKKVTSDLTKELNESSKINSQLGSARENLVKLNEELTRFNAKQLTQTVLSQQNIAIQNIMKLNNKGVHGTVSDLGEVDPKYNTALSVAAGPRLTSIVVDSDKTAQDCIEYLKKTKSGVVTFLPLNKIKGNSITNSDKQFTKEPGVVGFAIDLVKFNPKYKDVFSYALGSTLVVDNINNARKIGVGNIRMATLEGDLLELSGAMVGGYRKINTSFKEKDFSQNIAKLEEETSRFKELVMSLEQKRVENENKVYELKNLKSDLEAELIKLEKLTGSNDLGELKKKQKELVQELDKTTKDLAKSDKEINLKSQEIEKLKVQRSELIEKTKNTKENQQLTDLESRRDEITSKILKLSADIDGFETQKGIYLKEKESTLKIIKDSEKELELFSKEITELAEKIKKNDSDLKEKDKVEKQFYNNFKNMFEKRNKINEVINKKDNNRLREEEKIKAVEYRINNISIDRAKVVAELESINEEYKNYLDVPLRRGVEIEELKFEIKKFEGLKSQMGNINMRALEVYDKVDEEYKKVLDKVEVLKSEKEDVVLLMNEIEGKKKSLFMKTYKVLAENFRRIFASLSTKGDAHLEIEDEEHLFETGVDLKVKLTGNKYLDIKSLSGGEKTLTALAFIFAIQEYSPASFYLLDEVDAALDKKNSALLSKLIAKYSQNAQYIVISHNDSIISEANTIYGVSMQEGITKIVSLKI
ncbi:MAG: chromosome segregation protein SMC [Candidatus Nanoarchaeia archaeon]|nr:chromosome segregation protein SMC [Candidatus Nanoarchaeia archaeon]